MVSVEYIGYFASVCIVLSFSDEENTSYSPNQLDRLFMLCYLWLFV